MLVFYDAGSGDILYTAELGEGAALPPGDHIEVEGPVHPALWRVVDGALVARADGAAAIRSESIDAVNRMAGEVRGRFITVIPGQEMLYLLKESEAREFLADPAPDLPAYPLISAEIGITGADGAQVAQVYLNLGGQLRAVAAMLETARLGTVAMIEGTDSPAVIEGAIAAFTAALEAFP